jgi:transposase
MATATASLATQQAAPTRRRGRVFLAPEQIARIRELNHNRTPPEETAKQAGVSRSTVFEVLRRLRLKPFSPKASHLNLLPQKIKACHARGLDAHQIGATLGISAVTAWKYLKKLGLKPNKPRKGQRPQSTESSSNFLRIRISKTMRQMAALRNASLPVYLAELVEADRATTREKDFEKTLPLAEKAVPLIKQVGETHRRKIDGVKMQRILYLLTERVSIQNIAARFGLAVESVRKIECDRVQSAIRVPTPWRGGGSRGVAISLGQTQP